MLIVREARADDADAVWSILEPMIRAGETYPLPREMNRQEALAYWFATGHEVFVAQDDGMVGTYFLRANQNQGGGGSHGANCGYVTATVATGRGVARTMCEHSLRHAKQRGFRAMQFNFVVSNNERALRLWKSFGFEIVGRIPKAFLHPTAGYTDVYVMYRSL
jgi:ribosomal protein S18 acetylase RimI-like enzyme